MNEIDTLWYVSNWFLLGVYLNWLSDKIFEFISLTNVDISFYLLQNCTKNIYTLLN